MPAAAEAEAGDLLSALTLGDQSVIEKLLSAGSDPNNLTPLFDGPVWLSSLLMGQKSIFYAMTRSGRVSFQSGASSRRVGAEALSIAAARDYTDVVEFVLSEGVDVNARLSVGSTALLIAAANGNAGVVRMLVARRADVNAADQFADTPLMAATRSGSLPTVRSLLSAGAAVNAVDNMGRTALWWAARSGREDIVMELMANAADVRLSDKGGSSPFSQANKARYARVAQLVRADGVTGSSATRSSSPYPRTIAAAIDASLPSIQAGVELWFNRTKCSSCHHTVLGTQALLMAKRAGKRLNAALIEQQFARFRDDLVRHEKRDAQASLSRVASARSGKPSEDRAYGLAGATLPVIGLDGLSDERFENQALVLANLQFEDGRWIHGMARFPIESSDLLTTAEALRTIQQHSSTNNRRIAVQIARAMRWLEREPCLTTDDLIGKLYGLFWGNSDKIVIRQAAQALLREQRQDGSWAQKPGMNGDAYATGAALFALYRTRQLSTTAAAYRRGVAYLLRTQEEDGSWLTPSRAIPLAGYLESGSPHGKHQFISFAGTCWATMALIASSSKPNLF